MYLSKVNICENMKYDDNLRIASYNTQDMLYEGEFDINKKFHGNGIIYRKNLGIYFIGRFNVGRMHVGRKYYNSQHYYEGLFKENCVVKAKINNVVYGVYNGECLNFKKHGVGSLLMVNGNKYDGEWIGDRQHGLGKYECDEYIYIGYWIDGLKHGRGVMTRKNGGGVYDGDWILDKANGIGCVTYYNGNKYIGGIFENQRHGFGVFTFSDGRVYKGNFVAGNVDGYGEIIFGSDSDASYSGMFSKNVSVGIGKLKYKSGHVYIGEFLFGKKHGLGILFNERGVKYFKGNFVDGKIDGLGKYYNNDIGKIVGVIKDGKFIEIINITKVKCENLPDIDLHLVHDDNIIDKLKINKY